MATAKRVPKKVVKKTAKSVIVAGITAGWTADRILKAVVKAVPESKADVSHIRYYSNRMVKDGDITQDQHDKYSTKKAPVKKALVKAAKAVKDGLLKY